jgi:lipoyl(octanoyl) transferase
MLLSRYLIKKKKKRIFFPAVVVGLALSPPGSATMLGWPVVFLFFFQSTCSAFVNTHINNNETFLPPPGDPRSMSTVNKLLLVHLGKVAYDAALAAQTSKHRALVDAARARSRAAAAAATAGVKASESNAAAAAKVPAASAEPHQQRPSSAPMGTVFVCEHSPGTFTCGRRDTTDGIKGGRDGMPIVHIRRGGGLTYHGPGQLTLYPVVDVQQLFRNAPTRFGTSPLRWYTWALEQCIIRTAARCGVAGCTASCTGVWAPLVPSATVSTSTSPTSAAAVEPSHGEEGRGLVGSSQPPLDSSVADATTSGANTSSSSTASCSTSGGDGGAACGRREESNQLARTSLKLGFVGLQAEAWISMHGFSINVLPESVTPFNRIVVCELPDARATSLQEMRNALRAAGVAASIANDMPLTVDEVARIAVEELGIITGCSYDTK